jgi:predicted AlkP superfamily pyrophosphatase or phosphodiesterase
MSFGKMVSIIFQAQFGLFFNKKKLTDFYFPGTYADYMKNVFPTKTFPNHHSIATGKYPKEHGVLANVIFDKKLGKLKYSYEMFHMNSEDIQPIWVSGRVPNFFQCLIYYSFLN